MKKPNKTLNSPGIMDAKQRAVCLRLLEFRKTLQICRSLFAVSAGLGSERLASSDSCRARLPYLVFKMITERYQLNPHWLAGNSEPMRLDVPFDDSRFAGKVHRAALFTAVYDAHIASTKNTNPQPT